MTFPATGAHNPGPEACTVKRMTRQRYKENKRRQIAGAALEVFTEAGFEAAPVRQIAQRAGVGKGTVYEYFESKDALIAEAIALWFATLIRQGEDRLAGISDPAEKLRAYVRFFVEMFLADDKAPRFLLSVFQLTLTRLDDTTHGVMLRDMFRAGAGSMESILVEGMQRRVFRFEDPGEAHIIAVNLTAFLDGICLDYLLTGGDFDLTEQVEHYLGLILNRIVIKTPGV